MDQFRELLIDVFQFRVQTVIGVNQESSTLILEHVNVIYRHLHVRGTLRGSQENVGGDGSPGSGHRLDRLFESTGFEDSPHGEVVGNAKGAAGGRQGVQADADSPVVEPDVADQSSLGDTQVGRLSHGSPDQHQGEGVQIGIVIPILGHD